MIALETKLTITRASLSSSAYTSADVAGLKDRTYSAGGNYTVGPVRLNAGYFHYTGEQGALGNRKDNAYTVSAKFAPEG